MSAEALQPSPVTRSKIPFVVLAVSLLITCIATYAVWRSAYSRDEARFERWAEQTRSQISQRMETYVTLLNGGAGLFASSEHVTVAEFRTYVERLRLGENYPGMQGIGFSAREAAIGKQVLRQAMELQGFTDFKIYPADPPRDEYHAIIYLEPLDERNRNAIGYDMFSEPTRRTAMERARDTSTSAACGKVTLVQEIDPDDAQAGFLIYTPVYYAAKVPPDVESRRKALLGFVYSPFRSDDLLDAVAGSLTRHGLVLRVYDGNDIAPETLLHRSDRRWPLSEDYVPRFTSTVRILVAGRPWTLVTASGPEFEQMASGGMTMLILLGGGALSFLLAGLSLSQARARSRAERAAADLRRSESALRVSESKFRRLAESNLIGVAFADTAGHILDGNEAFFAILGRTREETQTRRVRWDDLTPPEYREGDLRYLQELSRRGACTPFETEFARPDGSRVAVLLGVALLEGSTTEAVAVCVDLTERKQAEAQLRAARDVADAARRQAEEANRLKDEFLATVSHELRTPLNAILGWAQILRGNDVGPEDVEHGLDTIERNARAQAQLIGDLLDVSRIVSGKLRLDLRTVDLPPIVEAAIEACRPAADAKGVQLDRFLDASAGPVDGDPDRLQQVVWNLISNAVKFTPRGGRAEVLLRRGGGGEDATAEIIVSDTGHGIDPQFLPHVFDRFRQADATTTRQHGGLGLGLAIVRHIVELHGGSIEAHSEGENRGATFVVSLPLTRTKQVSEPMDPLQGSSRPVQTNDEAMSLMGLRVLVVDDDPDSRDLVGKILQDGQADVSTADSVAEALAALQRDRFDVLISDIGMPAEDGYSLLQRIRALELPGNGHLPAVALTALARAADRTRAINAGFDLHLTKPIEPGALRAAVARVAGRTPGPA
jgi:PAS domain S-box-containing protein